jgi:tetratricopeptide (TPR) repeat protein
MSKINITFVLFIVILAINLPAKAQQNKKLAIEQQAFQMIARKDYGNAIKLLNEAIKIDKGNIYLYYLRGVACISSKRYSLGLPDINIVITKYPNVPSCYYYRGIAKSAFMQYDEALTDFNKVIKLTPREDQYHYLSNTYHFIGMCYFIKGDYELAIKNFDECLRINPQESLASYFKALSWDRKDEGTEAIKAYRVFLRFATNADAAKIQHANTRIAALSEEAETEKSPKVSARKPRKKLPKPAEPKTDVGKLFSAPLGEDAF